MSTYSAHLKDFSHDLDDESKSDMSLPPYRRNRGQRTYLDATKPASKKSNYGTDTSPVDLTASTASETKSLGSITMTEFDNKLQQAMDAVQTLKTNIDANQQKLLDQSTAAESRMKKLENSVLSSFESIANLSIQQKELQTSISDTNERLVTISELLTTLVSKENTRTKNNLGSPTRKKVKTFEHPEEIEPGEMIIEESV